MPRRQGKSRSKLIAEQHDANYFLPQSETHHWWVFGKNVSSTMVYQTTVWRISEANLRLLYSQLQVVSQTPLSPGKRYYQIDCAALVDVVLGDQPILILTADALAAVVAGILQYWKELAEDHPGYYPDGPPIEPDLPQGPGLQN